MQDTASSWCPLASQVGFQAGSAHGNDLEWPDTGEITCSMTEPREIC